MDLKTLYFAIPESRDGCRFPTVPDPMPLDELAKHLQTWIDARQKLQGYFSNCRQERIPMNELSFTIVPEDKLFDQS